jgi:mRNA interferase HigB
MKIIGRDKLEEFKKKHSEVISQIDSWEAEVEDVEWKTPQDIRRRYSSASFLADNHIIFDIKENKYRLKIQVNYKNQIVLIKNIGTHSEYMKW